MSTLRGRGRNLEIAVDRALGAAVDELRAQFAARPDFYRGSRAVANLGILEPPADELAAFRDALAEYGITLDGVSGSDALAGVVAELELAYLGAAGAGAGEVAVLPRQRTPREVRLSEEARSLAADFAGAREDMVRRRKTGPAPAPSRRPRWCSRRPGRRLRSAWRRSTTAARCAAARPCTTWATWW